MLTLNRVFLIGNLTRDPDLRFTPQGTAVCELRVAVNDSFTPRGSTEKREKTLFIDVVTWRGTAENCKKYLAKGRGVLVEGRLEQDTWVDKESGQNRSRIRVVASQVTFMPRFSGGGGGGDYGGGGGGGGGGGEYERRDNRGSSNNYGGDRGGAPYEGSSGGGPPAPGATADEMREFGLDERDDDVPF